MTEGFCGSSAYARACSGRGSFEIGASDGQLGAEEHQRNVPRKERVDFRLYRSMENQRLCGCPSSS